MTNPQCPGEGGDSPLPAPAHLLWVISCRALH